MNEDEFTLNHYRRLVELAKSKRRFVKYGEMFEDHDSCVQWRHDVDMSLGAAIVLAEIDCEHDVQSTFFVNIHADTYNACSARGKTYISRIREMGHEIGIHLDSEFYGQFSSHSQLEAVLSDERQIFEKRLGVEVKAFSFHNPTAASLKYEDLTYCELVNCYSYFYKNMTPYVSDSNGYWRFRSIEEFLVDEGTPLVQVLTHAEWWNIQRLAPRERMAKALFEDVFSFLTSYDNLLHQHERTNKSEVLRESADSAAHTETSMGRKTFMHIYGESHTST